MNEIIQNTNYYLEFGQYHIDGRDHGILQNTKNSLIKVVFNQKTTLMITVIH